MLSHVDFIHNWLGRSQKRVLGAKRGESKERQVRKRRNNTTEEHSADAIDHQIRSQCQNGLLNIYRREMDE